MSLTRDGHLSDLALERVLAGERVDEAAAHASGCELCARRIESARAMPLDVRPPGRAPVAWSYLLAGTLAAAAALLVYTRLPGEVEDHPVALPSSPEAPVETWRVRGSFHFQLFVHDGDEARRARDGERVHPGDRLGFKAELPRDGHLLIAGIDARDEAYLCHPQATGGRSAEVARGEAASDEAVRLDAVLGTEEVVAIFCDAPFDFAQTAARLKRDQKAAPAGCQQRSFKLQKVPR